MNKVCPRCQEPAVIQAPECLACGHRYRTAFTDRTLLSAPSRQARRPWSRTAGLIVAAILLLLAFTNPTRQEYLRWAKAQFAIWEMQEPGHTPLDVGIEAGLAGYVLDGLTQERNFLVGTVFWMEYEGHQRFRVLGIARQLIPLDPLPAPAPPVLPAPHPAPAPPPVYLQGDPAAPGMQNGPMSSGGFRRRAPASALPPPPVIVPSPHGPGLGGGQPSYQ